MLQVLLGPKAFGIWGEGLSIFKEMGKPGNYFSGAGEQAYSLGDLETLPKSKK